MWKSTLAVGAGLAVVLGAVWVGDSIGRATKARAQGAPTEELTFLGKTPVVGTYEYIHHYRSKDGTNCFVVVVERVVKTAQHLSCVRN